MVDYANRKRDIKRASLVYFVDTRFSNFQILDFAELSQASDHLHRWRHRFCTPFHRPVTVPTHSTANVEEVRAAPSPLTKRARPSAKLLFVLEAQLRIVLPFEARPFWRPRHRFRTFVVVNPPQGNPPLGGQPSAKGGQAQGERAWARGKGDTRATASRTVYVVGPSRRKA